MGAEPNLGHSTSALGGAGIRARPLPVLWEAYKPRQQIAQAGLELTPVCLDLGAAGLSGCSLGARKHGI